MEIPEAKQKLLDEVAATLAQVPSVLAVALGGSHARGMHTGSSDLDIAIYYREANPFRVEEIRRIARHFSTGGEPTVTDFYGWGPFVNGGAWIVHPVCKIDFLYRNLDQLERIIAQAARGEWQHSFDQQPPFGFRSVTTLGEIHIAKPLHDPNDVLAPLKAAVAVFPPKLKDRIIADTLWGAEFSFFFAANFAATDDVPNTVACMTRIFHYLVQALFALNETYFINDKRMLTELERFPRAPKEFGTRASAILSAAGRTPDALNRSLGEMRALFDETVKLTNGTYKPRFAPSC